MPRLHDAACEVDAREKQQLAVEMHIGHYSPL